MQSNSIASYDFLGAQCTRLIQAILKPRESISKSSPQNSTGQLNPGPSIRQERSECVLSSSGLQGLLAPPTRGHKRRGGCPFFCMSREWGTWNRCTGYITSSACFSSIFRIQGPAAACVLRHQQCLCEEECHLICQLPTVKCNFTSASRIPGQWEM